MLVTSRERDEKVILDLSDVTYEQFLELQKTPIWVMPVDIRGPKVRIGVQAPRYVGVDREEVWKSKQASKRAAAETAAKK